MVDEECKKERKERVRIKGRAELKDTVFPRSSDLFYIVTCYIKWVTTSWTDGTEEGREVR